MPRDGDALFTELEVRSLLERDEGQFIEFKSLWDLREATPKTLDRRQARDFVAENVAAFANADGGTLFLGVDDEGKATGHGYPEEAIEELLAVSTRRLRPPVHCRVQRMRIDKQELVIIQVPMTSEAVMVDGNGFPYRAGDQVLREPQEVINQRKQAYRRVGYEQRIRADASLDDIDRELAMRLLADTVFRTRPLEDALERFGLIVPRPGGHAITNACLLLFAKPPLIKWHPHAGVRFFRVAGTERIHGVRRNVTQLTRVDLPLATSVAETQRIARDQVRRSEKLHDLFFREIPEYPDFAWQETIVNAIAHRDYEDQARETEVWFFDDRMEVRSPGDLVPPVTVELLRQRRSIHASRNPVIVRVLVEAGLMREEGEGVPRMFDEMEESFLRPPEFEVDHGEFCVALHNTPVFVGPTVEWQKIVQGLRLSDSQKRILVARPDGFTNEDYRTINRIEDRDRAYREIQEMVAFGVVSTAEAHGRGAVYRVARDLRQAEAFLSSRLPALREHFTKAPDLRNEEYRRIFSVSRFVAVRELKKLVEDGFLELRGQRRGARYVPRSALVSGIPK
ncbi:MAG: putative DNA binding domain-containing protein [Planctomycetes bacterium]|nr:putative DNA binding domain-containing protein [Planctomycetota bacterium]MBI3844694.1 putative DNA binding domain-containing protein [Planctomycetota bacterium]